jgi:hypothetical protein
MEPNASRSNQMHQYTVLLTIFELISQGTPEGLWNHTVERNFHGSGRLRGE